MSETKQLIDQLWNKMKERSDNVIIESNGELETIRTLDGKQIAMKGPAKYFKKQDDK